MTKILVTGVAGFMGSHIAEDLIQRGYEVVGIDNLIGGELDNVPSGVKFLQTDLSETFEIRELFLGVEAVVHAACTAYEGLSVFSPALVTQNTFQITSSVLSASVFGGVKKFIYLSSMARYGKQEKIPFEESALPNPQDPYGIAKLASEQLVKNICDTHGMDWSVLVPHNIIGPRQKYDDPYRNVAAIMINRMLQGKQPIIYGDGNQSRCFSFMQDVVDPIRTVIETNVGNREVINVGPDDEFISINQLAFIIGQLVKAENPEPIYVPGRPQEVEKANCSADKARKLLGYEPKVSLENGLVEMINWIRNRGVREFKYHLPLEIVNEKTPRTWVDRLI